MKASLVAAAAACLASMTSAIQLQKKDRPAVVAAPIQRKSSTLPPDERDRRRRLARRQKALSVDLDNEVTLYFANATLGTPAQSFRLHIDTGSSDMWVNTQGNGVRTEGTGTYSPSSSSTYQLVSADFNISYVDGSGALGDYATDTFTIGSASLEQFQFGVAYQSSSAEGVLGVGYSINEVQVNRAKKRPYPNLPEALVNAGLAASRAYSLWLNDLDANTGTILFGGVDTDKYSGSLQTLPIIPYGSAYAEFIIALTGVSSGQTSFMTGEPIPVLLDSGSSLTYLPENTTRAIFDQYDVRYSRAAQAGIVSCDAAGQGGSVDFDFSGVKITVPLDELVLVAETRGGVPTVCRFGIAPIGGNTFVLGDSFLRSAYVVYDLENNGISLAQTVYNATTSNVQEITSSGVPDASAVSGAVTAVAGLPTGNLIINGASDFPDESAGVPTAGLPSTFIYALPAAAVALGAIWHDLRLRRAL